MDRLSVGQHVTILVIVLNLAATEKEKTKEGTALVKQESQVCDESGCLQLVLWENEVGAVEDGKSYNMIGVGVHCLMI